MYVTILRKPIALMGLCLISAGVSQAAVIEVDEHAADDEVNGNCSIVEAVKAAEDNVPVDACPAGDDGEDNGSDVIRLPSNSSFELTNSFGSFAGTSGFPTVKSAMTIEGNGSHIYRSDAEGTGPFRIFHFTRSADVVLKDLRMSNGRAENTGIGGQYMRDGGAIVNKGLLTLENVHLDHHHATLRGGAIMNLRQMTLRNVLIEENYARGNGAAAYAGKQARSTVRLSTIRNNHSDTSAGGIFNRENARWDIAHTTIAHNTSVETGAGIYDKGSMVLSHVTIKDNAAINGINGVYSVDDAVTYLNASILSHEGGNDCSGATSINRFSLVHDGSCEAVLQGDPQLQDMSLVSANFFGFAPTEDSPVLDYEINCVYFDTAVSTPEDGDANGVRECDLGSVELSTSIKVANGEVAIDENGVCSIREALENALQHASHTDCNLPVSTKPVVLLSKNGAYVFENAMQNEKALPELDAALILDGNGSTFSISGADMGYIQASANEEVIVENLRLEGGGESIRNYGTLRIENVFLDSPVFGNYAFRNDGDLVAENLQIFGANGRFLTAFQHFTGTLVMRNSAIVGTHGEYTGNFRVLSAERVELYNITISGGISRNTSGAWIVADDVILDHVTIRTGRDASGAYGATRALVLPEGSTNVTITNSVFDNGRSPFGINHTPSCNIGFYINLSLENNYASSGGCRTTNVFRDILGEFAQTEDGRFYWPPQPGSPLIDAVACNDGYTDALGNAPVDGDGEASDTECDIGAVEYIPQ